MLMPILNPITMTDFDQSGDQEKPLLLLCTRDWVDLFIRRGEWTVSA
jgi:hypothetical protein